MAIRNREAIVRIDGNYNNQKVTNTAHYKRRVENKERLGWCSVNELGPRGPKGRLIKLKRNRPNRRCSRDCEKSG
jgi:hypothetical protein